MSKTTKDDYYEERAAELISRRNLLVREGADPTSVYVNSIEDRAARFLSRSKGKTR